VQQVVNSRVDPSPLHLLHLRSCQILPPALVREGSRRDYQPFERPLLQRESNPEYLLHLRHGRDGVGLCVDVMTKVLHRNSVISYVL
jgi:hypothetical protein